MVTNEEEFPQFYHWLRKREMDIDPALYESMWAELKAYLKEFVEENDAELEDGELTLITSIQMKMRAIEGGE